MARGKQMYRLKGDEPMGILPNGTITAQVGGQWFKSHIIEVRGDIATEVVYLDKPLSAGQVHIMDLLM